MKRKVLAALLTLTIAGASLAGCSGGKTGETTTAAQTQAETKAETKAEAKETAKESIAEVKENGGKEHYKFGGNNDEQSVFPCDSGSHRRGGR